MARKENVMEKFGFLLGTWHLGYRIPKSMFSEADTGSGTGTFKRVLDDRYVCFDYSCSFSSAPEQTTRAHAIYAWDEKANVYKVWWFESSGNFTDGTCNFVNDEILYINWHNGLFVQTFKKAGQNEIILRMEHPDSEGKYELAMEVIFTRE